MRAVLLILTAVVGSAPLHAQSIISGRVVDPSNRPVADVEVLLHAISGSSGSQIDQDTSRNDGRFDLRVSSVNPEAIYFVAVTYRGQLYMGDMLRPPIPSGREYIVQVGVNPVDFGGTARTPPATMPVQQNDAGLAGRIVIVVAIAVVAGVIMFVLRRRPPEQRRLLVELARIEDEIATASGPDAVLERRRSELRQRLLGSKPG